MKKNSRKIGKRITEQLERESEKVIIVNEEIENRKETRRNVKRKYEQAEEETEGIRI